MSTQIRGNKQIKNITIENDQILDSTIELNKLKEGAELFKRDGSVEATNDLNIAGHQLKNIGTPIDDTDAIRKMDLDELAAKVSGTLINRELVSGVKDGVNVTFTLANEPTLATEQIFLNGLLLNAGANSDYSIEGNVITFTVAPQATDTIIANYIVEAIQLNVDVQATLSAFNGQLTTVEGELFEVEQAVVELGNDADVLSGRVTTAEEDISSLGVRATNLENNVDVVEADLSAESFRAMAAESALDARIGEAEFDILGLSNRVSVTESDISALESADSAMDSRVGNIEDGLQAETSARISAVNSLTSRVVVLEGDDSVVDGRLSALESDVSSLESGLSSEASTRLTNDNALQSNINSEIAARTAADSVLQSNINQEVANRVAADNALDARIETLENAPAPIAALSDLSDVTVTTPSNGQVLQYNGTEWVNGAAPSTFSGSYDDLSDKPDLSVYALDSDLFAVDVRVEALEDNAFVTREVPSGSVNGSNTSFTLANMPISGSEQVFVNGLLQHEGSGNDYTISGDTISFVSAPEVGWKIHVSYATGSYSVAPAGMGSSNFSGSYNDLTDKPTIPSITQIEADIADHESRITTLEDSVNSADVMPSIDQLSGVSITSASNGQVLKYNGLSWINASDNTFSGSYNDLSDKPSIPSLSGYATTAYVDSAVAGVSSGGGSGSGDIEVYQDEEFAWSVNHNYNPSLVRTITHSKGRRPDIIKVFVKYNNTWKEEADFYTYVSDTSRGWFDDTTNASNTDPANKTMIALYQHTPQYYGVTSVPCRIRLYWFGNHNLATQSAGAYSVGGGLTGGEYVIPTFSHPQQTGTNKVAYTITHNLNTLTPIVCAQVNATTGDFGASASGWMNIPTYFPMGNWTEYYGHNVEIVDANTIRLVLFGIGNGSRQVKGIIKK